MKSDHQTHDEIRWMQRGLPTWPVLLSFVEVAASGSVTKTADRMNLTQSAVSHHIAQMERFVGERLFERSAKTMRPTAKAQMLARQLRDQLRMLSETIEAARPRPAGMTCTWSWRRNFFAIGLPVVSMPLWRRMAMWHCG